MNDHDTRYARLRYTAMGALVALAVASAIAGSAALAAKPGVNTNRHTAGATDSAKTPSEVPSKTEAPPPAVNYQPFLEAVQQLVNNGTISTTQGQALDRQIQAGRIDTDTLTGFTPAQLQAVQQALANAKRALMAGMSGGAQATKEPPPAGPAASCGGKEPPPEAAGDNPTPK